MIIVLIHGEHTFSNCFAKDSLNLDSRLVSQPDPLPPRFTGDEIPAFRFRRLGFGGGIGFAFG